MNAIPNRTLNKKLFKILVKMNLAKSFTSNSCWIKIEGGAETLLMSTQKIMPMKIGGFIFETDGEKITIELEQEI